jgi:TRAP-type C4-dicarboxylate transport system permease small subunit
MKTKITPQLIGQYFEEIVASLLFVVTLSLVIVNVLTRYVFRTGIPWAEEMATSCFVWTAFIGSAACYKRRAHIGVDILVNKLPVSAQNVVKILVDVFMILLCAYMFYLSVVYLKRSYRKPTAILGVSSAWVSSSLTLSFLDMTIWSVIFVIRDLKSIKQNGRVIIEGREA